MKPGRLLAAALALQLAAQPLIAAVAAAEAPAFDAVYARYLRGEASLGEMEAARRGFQQARASEARPTLLPAPAVLEDQDPGAGQVPDQVPGAGRTPPEGARPTSTLGRIGAWIRDIPRRTVRRWGPDEQGFETAEQANRFLEESVVPAYTANATQREADSTWVRPVKVTAQAEVNKIQAVIERVVAFGGLAALTKAVAGDAGAQQVVAQGARVASKLTATQRQQLMVGLSKGGFASSLNKLLAGKPTSVLGKLIKDDFGNNILIAVAASGIVSAFLNDGLDLDTLKDHLVALNAVNADRTRRENLVIQPLEAVAYFHMDKAVSSSWKALWTKATSGGGRFATMLGQADDALSRFGSRFVKAPPAELAEKAANFGRQAGSLGLPGVSGATSLSLAGVAESIFKAGTLGLIGMPLIDTGWRAIGGLREGHYIGGNRERIFARYDLYDTYFQRTGSQWRDMLEERKVAIANLWEAYQKFPFTHAFDWFLRFVGGYTGAVVASSLVAPVGIGTFAISLVVSAIFAEGGVALGKWLGAKLDTNPRFYERLRRKNARHILDLQLEQGVDTAARRDALRQLGELDRFRAALGIRTREDVARVLEAGGSNASRLAALARGYARARQGYAADLATRADARADDYEKLMRVSQVNSRIKFVRSFEDVKLTRRGNYIRMEFPGFEGIASPRYDLITAEGRRGIWDYKTNRVIDVGKVSEHNGRRIIFLDDAGVAVQGGVIHAKPKEELERSPGNLFISKDGLVLEKSGDAKKKREWLVRGYGGEYDLVLRGSGRRFAWDGERFVEVVGAGSAAAAASEPASGAGGADGKKEEKKEEKTRALRARAQAFSAKLVHTMTRSLAGDPSEAADDRTLVHGALADLAGLHGTSGRDLGERYARALLARR